MRVELGGDHWADLKDADLLTNGDRKAALLHYYEANVGGWVGEAALYDGYLRVLVEKWSLDLPLPSEDVTVMDRLSLDQSNRLYGAVRWVEAASKPDFSPDGRMDPKAGSASSGG